MNNEYDEIKNLIKKSKLLKEQSIGPINLAKDIEKDVTQTYDQDMDKPANDYNKKYRISGGILSIHGDNSTQVALTTDDKIAFQETMEEFVSEVADLVDFGQLNLYKIC